MKRFVIGSTVNHKKIKIATKDLSFRPAVYGLIFKKNSILLCPNWDGYDFPGGGMNVEETLQEALLREVWEETGLVVEKGKLVAVESNFFAMPTSKRKVNSIAVYFLCKNPKGVISDAHFDEDEKKYAKHARWVAVRELRSATFYNSVPDSFRLIQKAYKLWKRH